MLRLAYGLDPLQFGELYIPNLPGPHPTVILIHGGFWRNRYNLSLMTPLAECLVTAGLAAWNIEFRRVGDPGGGWPGTLLDVAAAADHLHALAADYALDLRHIAALGHSAGGHLACWLAGRHRLPTHSPLANERTTPLSLTGAISLAGAVDLEHVWKLHLSNDAVVELLGGTPDDLSDRYHAASPVRLLPLGVPQILVHGTADENVPFQISQDYAAAAREAGDPVTLLELAGADHFVVIDPQSAAWASTLDCIERLLLF